MKQAIITTIAASMLISSHSVAEEINAAFGLSLGERLDTSNFTKVDISSSSPYQDFWKKHYGKTYFLYSKIYNHSVFKRIEVLTDGSGAIAQITGISDLVDYKPCKEEGNALSEKLHEKYNQGDVYKQDGRFAFEDKRKDRIALGGCNSENFSLENVCFLWYTIYDRKLLIRSVMKSKKMEKQRLEKMGTKYKNL